MKIQAAKSLCAIAALALTQSACMGANDDLDGGEETIAHISQELTQFGFTAFGQKQISSCFVNMSSLVYLGASQVASQTNGTTCGSNYTTYNTPWSLLPNHSDHIINVWYRDIVRQSTPERQYAIAWRGSADAGDWLDNLAGQLYSVTPQDNAIATVPSTFSGSARIASAWHRRVRNYAGRIDAVLSEGESFQNQSGGGLRIFHTGHSRGGADATTAALYTAMRYRGQADRAVEIYAFNPARQGNGSLAQNYAQWLDTVDSSNNSFMYHQFTIRGDAVHGVPLGGYNHPVWNTDGDETISNPINRTFNNCPHYHGPRQSFFNPIANHTPVTLWLDVIDDLYQDDPDQLECMTQWQL